ncbi:MAG: hypothetical protein B5766_07315 [Candidatus Lumbricidophila eiseniae]|uniref:Nucleotidyltransferase n=1 Tax=Candidatus Lumbricidiphila eiseniae TaxID=1969409 RepID=A0A2A6FRS3_9MICO|nr:MAG: hypothetical protein B5766_07315 [Candidatus Lumbricidophila eiseniae]
MARLRQQFKDALSSIEPSDVDRSNAPEAHRLVREALMADDTLKGYGISPVLIGSYKRSVSIRRVKDVDVLVRLPDLPQDVTADKILDCVVNVLRAEFGTDSVKRQARSVKVAFPDYDLDVDAVPARPCFVGDGTWEIPVKNSEDEWIRTNPEKLTELSTEMNSEHAEFYVPTVKLLRQTRRTLLAKGARPSGFTIEAAAYEAFRSGVVGDDNATFYVSALEGVSAILTNLAKYGIGIPDPTLSGATIQTNATADELNTVSDRFAVAAVDAAAALTEDDLGKSALVFQKLFGVNGDGKTVFQTPDGFDEKGRAKAGTITSGAATVPAGTRTFG